MTDLLRRREATARRLPTAPRRRPVRFGHEAGAAWLFLTPTMIVLVLFTVIPTVIALALSFTDIGIRDLRDPFAVNFAGLDSFTAVLANSDFQRAILNTVLFVVIGVPLTIVAGLLLAVALNNGIRHLRPVYRTAVYVPVVANIVAAAVIWKYALGYQGPINEALTSLGIPAPNWLGDPQWAVTAVLMLTLWRNVGTAMVLFLAGLQAIPDDVKEAASLDGAGAFSRFWHVTLPLLRPTTLMVSVLITVMYMNIFEEPYLLTGGGPLGSTRSLSLWIYEQFGFGNIAASMAGSFVLLVLVAVVSIVQFRLLRPKH